jgi:hypothetical protein
LFRFLGEESASGFVDLIVGLGVSLSDAELECLAAALVWAIDSCPAAIAALQPLFVLLAEYTDAEAFPGIAVALELGPRFLGLFQRETDVNVRVVILSILAVIFETSAAFVAGIGCLIAACASPVLQTAELFAIGNLVRSDPEIVPRFLDEGFLAIL